MAVDASELPDHVNAVNLHFHLDALGCGSTLAAIDRLATYCRERYLGSEHGRLVFTTRERLDGATGTVDVLLAYGKT